MQELRKEESSSTRLLVAPPGPNGRAIHRVGLMQAVLEVMATPLTLRPKPEPKEAPADRPTPANRHERRKAAALARRGRP